MTLIDDNYVFNLSYTDFFYIWFILTSLEDTYICSKAFTPFNINFLKEFSFYLKPNDC